MIHHKYFITTFQSDARYLPFYTKKLTPKIFLLFTQFWTAYLVKLRPPRPLNMYFCTYLRMPRDVFAAL